MQREGIHKKTGTNFIIVVYATGNGTIFFFEKLAGALHCHLRRSEAEFRVLTALLLHKTSLTQTQ